MLYHKNKIPISKTKSLHNGHSLIMSIQGTTKIHLLPWHWLTCQLILLIRVLLGVLYGFGFGIVGHRDNLALSKVPPMVV